MLGAKLETGNPRAQNCPDIHLIAFMLDSLRSFKVARLGFLGATPLKFEN